jgi:hypothetical protein
MGNYDGRGNVCVAQHYGVSVGHSLVTRFATRLQSRIPSQTLVVELVWRLAGELLP